MPVKLRVKHAELATSPRRNHSDAKSGMTKAKRQIRTEAAQGIDGLRPGAHVLRAQTPERVLALQACALLPLVRFCSRHCAGVIPMRCLKARWKAASD